MGHHHCLGPRPSGSRALATLAVALLLLAVALGCGPGDPLEAIRQQQAAGDFAGSIEPLRALLRERPKDPETNYLYGRALVLTGQPSLATWSLHQAMDDPAWLAPAGMQLAQASLITGDLNEAVKVTTRILEKHPDDAQALLYRAQAQAHWKIDPKAALADANRALELQPDLIEAYEPKILALLALDRHDEADEALAEAGRRLAESDAPARLLAWHCSTTAIFAADAGDQDKARETWKDCLEKYPTEPAVVTNAVEFYDKHRELERSIEVLRKALDGAPSQRSFRSALAERLRLVGRAAEGEALLREPTSDKDPRVAVTAWSDLAKFLHATGDHGAAADALAQAVKRVREVEEPGPQLLFQYADALVVSHQLDRALEVAKEIPVPAQSHLIRGRVAQERGDPAGALKEFDQALRVWPDNAVARYYTALAAEQKGDFDRALEEYRYAIRVDVGATDARTRAAKLLIAQGEYLRAYQVLFLEVDKAPLEPEGEALGMYLMARVANPKQLHQALTGLAQRQPGRLPLALTRGAEGAAERAGPRAALNLLVGAPGVDYTSPHAAPLLRALVRYAHAAGKPSIARKAIDAALAAHPEVAIFHEIQGLQLELGDASDEARAAYQRALELDPKNAGALAGLGRLALHGEPAQAVGFFDRAAAANPADPSAELGAARALRASGRTDEAERRLDALLDKNPFLAEAAAEIVSIDLERGTITPKTLDRAQRAARFGGGVEAYEQLSQVYTRLDQPDQAAEAAKRAQILRKRAAGAKPAKG
jgi:tetratricopeptide (TPR) repeat protein